MQVNPRRFLDLSYSLQKPTRFHIYYRNLWISRKLHFSFNSNFHYTFNWAHQTSSTITKARTSFVYQIPSTEHCVIQRTIINGRNVTYKSIKYKYRGFLQYTICKIQSSISYSPTSYMANVTIIYRIAIIW